MSRLNSYTQSSTLTRGILLLLVILQQVVPSFALDPKPALTQYIHHAWGLEDGLPQSSILEIAQTVDGFLWFGTYEGLVRYDGHTLQTYSAPHLRPIRDQYITALTADPKGGLWIGTQNGLHRFMDGSLESWHTSSGLVNDGVQDILVRGDEVWVGTRQGLNLFVDGQFKTWTSADGLADNDVRDLVWDENAEVLWIATQKGLSRLDPSVESWQSWGVEEGLGHLDLSTLYEGSRGLWIGTSGGGVYLLTEDGLEVFGTEAGLTSLFVLSVLEDRDGNLWIGTQDGGLYRLRPGELRGMEQLTEEDGLSQNYVTRLFEDREGNLWIGTYTKGFNRLQSPKFLSLTSREGLPHDLIFPILEDRSGDLWIGTGGGGLTRLRGEKQKTFTTADGLPHNYIRSLAEDTAGRLWIGTGGGGLSRLEKNTFVNFSLSEGLAQNDVRALAGDRDGSLWIGTWGGGLQNLRGDLFTTYTVADGLVEDFIMALFQDSEGSLWIASSSGAGRLKDGDFTRFTRDDGLSDNVTLSFHEDRDGTLWIGTENGLTRYRDGEMVSFTTDNGLFNNRFFKVMEDDFGNLWTGCNQGIFSVAKSELEAVARGEIEKVHSPSYGVSDGMKSYECNGGFQPAGWKRRDGTLWFPTIQGVVRVDPSDLRREVPSPVPRIDAFESLEGRVERQAFLTEDFLSIEARDFSIHYAAPIFSDTDKLNFEYILEGYDQEWSQAGDRRAAYYTNIAPGNYRFRVRAIHPGGEGEAELRLKIRAYFYETWIFHLALVLFFGLAILGIFRWRMGETLRRNLELQEMMEQLERQSAELERFTYTVSHDLKNPLVTIQGFLGLLERDVRLEKTQRLPQYVGKVRVAVERMQTLLDDLIEVSRIGHKIDKDPDIDLEMVVREAVVRCLEHRDENQFDVLIQGSWPNISGDRRRLVEVFRNLIENAMRFSEDEEQPRIAVKADLRGGEVWIKIRDNGVGIQKRYLEKIFGLFEKLDPATPGTGTGLAIVRRVVELHGGRVWAESEGAGKGSTFQIVLPLFDAA